MRNTETAVIKTQVHCSKRAALRDTATLPFMLPACQVHWVDGFPSEIVSYDNDLDNADLSTEAELET